MRAVLYALVYALAIGAWLVPWLPYLLILVDYPRSLRAGLIACSKRTWRLEITVDVLRIFVDDHLREEVPLGNVASARWARNANWSESKLVEDALSLFDALGHRIVKLPTRAEHFEVLSAALACRHVPVEDVDVHAPAYLD